MFDDRLTLGYQTTSFDQKSRQNSVILSTYRSKLAHGALSGRSDCIGATERCIALKRTQVLAVTADIWIGMNAPKTLTVSQAAAICKVGRTTVATGSVPRRS
jgi:hypothetical protein